MTELFKRAFTQFTDTCGNEDRRERKDLYPDFWEDRATEKTESARTQGSLTFVGDWMNVSRQNNENQQNHCCDIHIHVHRDKSIFTRFCVLSISSHCVHESLRLHFWDPFLTRCWLAVNGFRIMPWHERGQSKRLGKSVPVCSVPCVWENISGCYRTKGVSFCHIWCQMFDFHLLITVLILIFLE